MSANSGQCNKCGETNPYTGIVCKSCNSRLPWAQAAQTARQVGAAQPKAAKASAPTAQQPAATGPLNPQPVSTPAHYNRFCPHCSAPMSGIMTICTACGKKNTSPAVTANPDDEPSVFLNVASFLFPIIGFFVWIFLSVGGNRPRQSGAVGRSTGFGFLLGLGIVAIIYVATPKSSAPAGDDGSGEPQRVEFSLKDIDKTELENEIRDEYNAEKKRKGQDGIRCVKVSLVRETPNKFTGFAEISNTELEGTHNLDIEVVFDEEGTRIWKIR